MIKNTIIRIDENNLIMLEIDPEEHSGQGGILDTETGTFYPFSTVVDPTKSSIVRFDDTNVVLIKLDPDTHDSSAIIMDEVSGNVYPIGGGPEPKYNWSLTAGDFNKQRASIAWDTTHDIAINTTANAANGRRSIYIGEGVKPYNKTTDGTNYNVTDPPQYPIPIPPNATSCKYTVTPGTQFMGVAFYTYDSQTNTYTRTLDVGWKQGSHELSFNAGEYAYLTMALKYNSAGTTYPTEPSEITIDFN